MASRMSAINLLFVLFFSTLESLYSKVIKKVSIPTMVLHWVIKFETERTFLRDKLMIINKLYTLHPRRKKAFSSFLAISEDPLDEFFHFWLNIFAWFFLMVWCKNKENPPAQCLTIVILLYLKWSPIVQGTWFCNNRDKNVMIYATFLLV